MIAGDGLTKLDKPQCNRSAKVNYYGNVNARESGIRNLFLKSFFQMLKVFPRREKRICLLLTLKTLNGNIIFAEKAIKVE